MTFSASIRGAVITRCVSGGISTFASFLLVVFILSSPKGLKSPYSRIIFCLSLGDIFQSLGVALGPFAPSEDPLHIFGRGNVQSCNILGFFSIVGSIAVPWYTVHLTYYFLQRVKFKVKPTQFAKREEKWLHIIIWTYAYSVALYALFREQINPTKYGSMCLIAASPNECENTDAVECTRGKGAQKTILFTMIFTVIVVFITLFLVLGAFTLHVYLSEKQLQPTKKKLQEQTSLRKKSERKSELEAKNDEVPAVNEVGALASIVSQQETMYASNNHVSPQAAVHASISEIGSLASIVSQQETLYASNNNGSPQEISNQSSISKNENQDEETSSVLVDAKNELSKYEQQALDLVLTKSAIVQSSLYIFAFMLVYSGPIITLPSGYRQSEIVYWWTSIFYPLGGIFNIIIYTRPKVQAVKKILPDISTFLSFLLVLSSGGETPNLIDLLTSDGDDYPSRPPTDYASRIARAFGFDLAYNFEEEIDKAMRDVKIDNIEAVSPEMIDYEDESSNSTSVEA